jgi:hypothetical protein
VHRVAPFDSYAVFGAWSEAQTAESSPDGDALATRLRGRARAGRAALPSLDENSMESQVLAFGYKHW